MLLLGCDKSSEILRSECDFFSHDGHPQCDAAVPELAVAAVDKMNIGGVMPGFKVCR